MRRYGFTLIELLVVIAIIAVLLGLLLPAVQKVRESANKVDCANNLHQLGVALHGYHGTASSFPPGYFSNYDSAGEDTGPGWGWAIYALPHLEQQNLRDLLQLDQPIEAPVHAIARTRILPGLRCPSDTAPPTWTARKYDAAGQPAAPVCDVASANYVGVFGINEPGVDGEGVFYRNSKVRLLDITDGTSQTIMVGERTASLSSATWVGAVTGAELYPYNASNMVLSHTAESNGPASPSEANNFNSRHDGGANYLFADGQVRFLTSSVNYPVFKALSTRAGGEPVGGF